MYLSDKGEDRASHVFPPLSHSFGWGCYVYVLMFKG